MSRYAGRKVVITGGTHGMGWALADRLLDGGAEVLVTGRDEGNVEAAREKVGARRGHVHRSDAASTADIAALAGAVGDRLGALDAVFINAGIALLEPFEQVTPERFDRTFAVNARGAFFATQALAPLVKDGGALVFTTVTGGGGGGEPGMSAYLGSKAAVWAFAQTFAAELLPRRIRVNAVAPGFIDTPTMGIADATAEERAALQKLGDEITLPDICVEVDVHADLDTSELALGDDLLAQIPDEVWALIPPEVLEQAATVVVTLQDGSEEVLGVVDDIEETVELDTPAGQAVVGVALRFAPEGVSSLDLVIALCDEDGEAGEAGPGDVDGEATPPAPPVSGTPELTG
jgi:NAD(P)-dependent dehydrogenase (short-subunit alcohol dehydrogenase family)